ncbi:hypothetical protein [Endozoicomonas sp. ONNA2]|uniref:hypothetical protein n=1 Tax=Endozoicomonas sp. ONNA2 TaxID=2828741 RepID=UPI0021498594|nr:hypothetical protein [Endozoicomonas sp. ONNA2]
MRGFGKVSARFWVDSEMETFSDNGKLLALYLLTTHHGNLLGIFRMPMGYIATDLKWDMDKKIQTFDELETKHFAKRSSNGDLIVINNYTKHNRTENNRQLDARLRLVLTLPENLDDLLPEAANVIDQLFKKPELVRAPAKPICCSNRSIPDTCNVRKKFAQRKEKREVFIRHMSDLTIRRPNRTIRQLNPHPLRR